MAKIRFRLAVDLQYNSDNKKYIKTQSQKEKQKIKFLRLIFTVLLLIVNFFTSKLN
jgi:hypothetical protein